MVGTLESQSVRESREFLRISQSELARRAHISRFKLNTFELGSGALTGEELSRIWSAIRSEADRLRSITIPTPSLAITEGRNV